MNKQLLIIPSLIIAVAITGFLVYNWQQSNPNLAQQATVSANLNTIASPTPTVSQTNKPSASQTPQPVEQTVKLFLVAVDDTSQGSFGCGDSLQGVTQKITTTKPLTDSIKALIAMDDQYYGESGLYNALWQSDLTLASASITDGVATIALTGDLHLGGTCDSPRVKEQLTATATQFASVTAANITVNGKPLDQVLSTK